MTQSPDVVPPAPPASAGLRAIAFHEAGHVVVGTHLGLEVLDADIERDDEGGRGHTHFVPPGRWFRPEPGRLTERERDLVERVVTTFMAGFAAEERLGSADPEGSGYDVDQTLREWLHYLEPEPARRPRLADGFFAAARAELARPGAWEAVTAVAEALLRERRLDGEAARRLATIGGGPV